MATLLTSSGKFYSVEAENGYFKPQNYKKMSNEQKIWNFVLSGDFQMMCSQDMRIKNYSIIQITVEEGNNFYEYGNDQVVEGLQIKSLSEEGLRCFMSKEIVSGRAVDENRILCAMTFMVIERLKMEDIVALTDDDNHQGRVCKFKDRWYALPLLGNDDQLNYEKILKAFKAIAWRKEVKLVGSPVWVTGTITHKGICLENTGALMVETLSRKGATKYMLCLPDNGKILINIEEKDLNVKEVNSSYGCYFKTRFNFFRFGDKKNLERRR